MTIAIGLDVGTQGAKALAYDTITGEIVGRGASAYDLPPAEVSGRAEQWPQIWIEGSIAAVRQAVEALPDTSKVTSIGVAGQQHGLVVLGRDKQVLRPCKLWCDTESAPEAAELSQTLGFTLVPSFTITKLLWLKRNEPEVFENVAHVLLPSSYVNWWLTGVMVMEAGDASGTCLLDVLKGCWDPKAIALVDDRIAGWLPPLIGHSQVVGTLTAEAATALGLPSHVTVSPGSGDNACSALGCGIVEPGPMILSLGTSGTLFGKAPSPLIDPSGSVCPFCDATGGGLPLLCTLNCTMLLGEVAAAFGMSHDALTELAAAEPPGARGVAFLPYLQGERTPNWPHASGAVLGLRPGLLQPGVLYRAALEGATFALLAGLRRIQALGLHPTELLLVGGGARNALWRQIVADAFQLPLRLPVEAESAALGAALQAAACAAGQEVASYVAQHPPPMQDQVVHPDPSKADLYQAAFDRHQSLGQTLFGSAASDER